MRRSVLANATNRRVHQVTEGWRIFGILQLEMEMEMEMETRRKV